MAKKLSYKNFVTAAIRNLRINGYKGIHTVFSGFNEAFREYYGSDVDPVEITKKLAEDGIIVIRPAKKGATLYLAEDAPKHVPSEVKETLSKILAK